MATNSEVDTRARLLYGLNGGTLQDKDKDLLQGFLLDFIHGDGDSDLDLTDESDEEEDDHGIIFDKINSSACSDNDDDETGGTAGPGGVQVGIASLLASAEINNLAIDPDRPAEMEKILNFDCKCQKRSKGSVDRPHVSCSQQLDPDVIWQTRMEMGALSKDQKDLVILGFIKACMNSSEMTQSTKKVNNKRKINRTMYMTDAIVVCRATFCFVFG